MPIYEYRCAACNAVVSVFQRSMHTTVAAKCDRCGGDDLSRMMSRFAFKRSVNDAFDDDFDDDAMLDGVDENDPRAMAQWARRMGDQMGGDLPPDFDDMVSRMEAGEMPDDDMGDDDELGF